MFENLINILRDLRNYFFPNRNPFGSKILATKDYYLLVYEKAKNEKFLEIDNLENLTGFNVDKSWLDELALHTQVVKKKNLYKLSTWKSFVFTFEKIYSRSKNKLYKNS